MNRIGAPLRTLNPKRPPGPFACTAPAHPPPPAPLPSARSCSLPDEVRGEGVLVHFEAASVHEAVKMIKKMSQRDLQVRACCRCC